MVSNLDGDTFGELGSLAAPLWVPLRALMGQHLQKQENKGVDVREGEGGRDSTLKNMGELVPATKSRYRRQTLKVVARRTQTLLQDEEQ